MFLLLLEGEYSEWCFVLNIDAVGCQLYAFVGFHIWIGLIFSLGLLIMNGYQFARGKYLVS